MTFLLSDELNFLKAYPHFDERPASILEFIGPDYLNIESLVREPLKEMLVDIFGEEAQGDRLTLVEYAMITGGIGIGKTTIASIVLPYMAHWVLCLKDPQEYFNLLPGSRIAFMQMSTSGKQAKEVVFGDVKARIENSPWFMANFPYDPNFKNQLRFEKDIWILPGDSGETTFEGYNILAGILDEADSHKVTPIKDYAEQGYSTIESRIKSRFGTRGFLLVIGQMKKSVGFASKKYNEMQKMPNAYTRRMAIWDSLGWKKFLKSDGTRDSFWFDTKRYDIVPAAIATQLASPAHLMEIPNTYRDSFVTNPVKALRDLAGIPPIAGSPYFGSLSHLEAARDRWIEHHGVETPVDWRGNIAPWFRATDSLRRSAHIDIAFSGGGDSLGFAMGHVSRMVEVEGELKPYIVIDLAMRVKVPLGQEIILGDIRRMVYQLRDERKFKLVRVTTDGFQSTDTRQQFEKRRISTELVSIDRNMAPYSDLRDAVFENRIEFPKYMVKYLDTDTTYTELIIKELSELEDDGKKVDHPADGSKDVADCLAGVVFDLMGDRTYHRRQHSLVTGVGSSGSSAGSPDAGAPMSPALPRVPMPAGGAVLAPWRPPPRS